MGARGPAPKRRDVLALRGSWRAAKAAPELRFPLTRPPVCPAWMPAAGKAEWKRQAAALEAAGILADVDAAALALWCEAWAEFVECVGAVRGAVKEAGMTYAINQGLIGAKAKAADRLLKLAAQFGFTPAARGRIKPTAADDDETENDKSAFFA